MYIGLHVKYPLLCQVFMKLELFLTDFRKKYSNMKFHENPPNGSPVVPCGRTEGRKDGRINTTNSRFKQLCEPS